METSLKFQNEVEMCILQFGYGSMIFKGVMALS